VSRDVNDKTERDIAIHRDVYALGVAIYKPEHLKKVCRIALEEMHGMDYAQVPYSLAHSLFQTMEVYIRSQLAYLGGTPLIEFDRQKGVVQMTALGSTVMKKLADRIRSNL